MSGYWYWKSDGQLWGPFSEAEFERLTQSDQVGSGDLVWHSAWSNWQPYSHDCLQRPPIPSGVALANYSPIEPVTRLVDEHLDHIGVPRHKQNEYQYVIILKELLESARENKKSRFSSIEMADEDLFYSAVSLMRDLVVACSDRGAEPFVGIANPERYKSIWRHRDLKKAFAEGADSREACPPPEVFSLVLERYHAEGLHSATFEWVLLDAMVASEIFWLGEEVKKNPSEFTRSFSWHPFERDMDEIEEYNAVRGNAGKLRGARLKRHLVREVFVNLYVFGLPIGLAVWADVNNLYGLRDALAMIVVVVVLVAFARMARWLWTAVRALVRAEPVGGIEEALQLWRNMLAPYSELEDGTASNPRRIRKRLARVVADGVGWNPNILPLLDRVIQRSGSCWT